MASILDPIVHPLPQIGRWVALVVLFLVPLQLTLSVVHEYSKHHLIVGDDDTPLLHTHGHLGDHATTCWHHHIGHQGNGSSGADPDDDDHGHIHLGHIQFVATTLSIATLELANVPLIFDSQTYPSIPLRRLDRPPLAARC